MAKKEDIRRRRVQELREEMNLDHGRIPPQAVELEEAVLGAMMLEKTALETVSEILTPQMFYKEAHALIYQAITTLISVASPVDILTVTHQLRTTQELERAGGPLYISSLTNRVASTANVETHARVVYQKHIGRELIRISGVVSKRAYDDAEDILDLLSECLLMFTLLEGGIQAERISNIGESIMDLIDAISKGIEKGTEFPGVPTGFKKLDLFFGGWIGGNFIVCGARPGMGKTAFGLSSAIGAAKAGFPSAFFSLEVQKNELSKRSLAQELSINSNDLKKGIEDRKRVLAEIINSGNLDKTRTLPVYFDDTAAMTIPQFRAKARRMVAKHGVRVIFIDYLQLMQAGPGYSGNRESEISFISRSIKQIAKELDIPIIAFSQLARSVEDTADKKPQLKHLRESGAIEQDADIVTFLYRPEYYGFTETADGSSTMGLAQLIVAKHRDGDIDLNGISLRFHPRQTKFTDYYDMDYTPSEPKPNNTFLSSTPSNNLTKGGDFSSLEDEFNNL